MHSLKRKLLPLICGIVCALLGTALAAGTGGTALRRVHGLLLLALAPLATIATCAPVPSRNLRAAAPGQSAE